MLIHRLTYRCTNHRNLHVRGYEEEGTTTTPFDMLVLNDMDRFRLVIERHRPHAQTRLESGTAAATDAGPVHPPPCLDPRARRGPARGPGLDPALNVLVVNAGSSSLKLRVLGEGDTVHVDTTVERWSGGDETGPLQDFLNAWRAVDVEWTASPTRR